MQVANPRYAIVMVAFVVMRLVALVGMRLWGCAYGGVPIFDLPDHTNIHHII